MCRAGWICLILFATCCIAKGKWKILSISLLIPFSLILGTNFKQGSTQGRSFILHNTAAYNYVKGLATCRSWPTCDVYGNIIEDEPYFNYSGGSMKPSVARTIGMEAGILKGYIEYFPSYKGLCDHLKDPKDHEHKKNTYIISREDGLHSTIGMGLSDKGNAKYYDKDTGTTTYSKKDREGDGYWLIIY